MPTPAATVEFTAERKRELVAAITAGRAARALTGAATTGTWVARVGANEVEVPAEVLPLLIDLLQDFAEARDVTVAPAGLLLGTTEASRLLGVSRPWLVQLLDRGDLPSERVGSKRRIALGALVDHRRKKSRELRQAAAEIGEALDAELDAEEATP